MYKHTCEYRINEIIFLIIIMYCMTYNIGLCLYKVSKVADFMSNILFICHYYNYVCEHTAETLPRLSSGPIPNKLAHETYS